jgi:hypothetical protein
MELTLILRITEPRTERRNRRSIDALQLVAKKIPPKTAYPVKKFNSLSLRLGADTGSIFAGLCQH